ncbi:MAG: hypothetical protein JNK64_03155 [Myxococcales bacterium]|nr:hypothetical protein [Myxococcales bacterium]
MAQVETELGEVVHEFRLGHRGRWLALQALVLGIAMLSLAMGGLALMLMPQPTALALVVARIMVGGGVAVLLVGAVLVPRAAHARGAGLALRIHTGGLVQVRDRKAEATRWQDVVDVREQLERVDYTTSPRTRYRWVGRIATARGTFELPREAGRSTLALVEAQARPHVWRRMISAFDQGAEFAFGAIVASRTGLTVGAERLAWSHVQLVTEEEHTLRVHTDFGGTVVDRFAVSFHTVLAELCEQVWTHDGDVAAIPRTLPPAPPPVLTLAPLPAARLVR